MESAAKPQCIEGLEDIVTKYDAFLIDQWGVIHDGKSLYPGAKQVLQELKNADKKVIILTNSSKTDEANRIRLLEGFGITRDLYSEVVSSAQLLLNLMTARNEEPWSHFGRKVFVVADGTDAILVQNTDLRRVDDVNQADIIMLLSISPGQSHVDHQDWICRGIDRNLPLVCPSADMLSVSLQKGVVGGMASVTGDYRQKGGLVINVGKPEAVVYEHCKQFLGNIEPARVLAIGDQIGSDVVGAKRYGYHAALVATGAAPETFPQAGFLQDLANAAHMGSNPGHSPDWVLPSLQWRLTRNTTLDSVLRVSIRDMSEPT